MDLPTEDYQQLLSKIDLILRSDFKLGIELIKSQGIDVADVAEFVYNNLSNIFYIYLEGLTIGYTIYNQLWDFNWNGFINIHPTYLEKFNGNIKIILREILEYSINE